MGFNWTCPACQRPQTVVTESISVDETSFSKGNSNLGKFLVRTQAIYCSNPDCQEVSLSVALIPFEEVPPGRQFLDHKRKHWPLIPESNSKPVPNSVPQPIADNYRQACRIRDLSPLASATMARRCLQGMIRDFCGISEKTLWAEIGQLKKQLEDGTAPRQVAPDTIEAIHTVRQVGNIGAHMEEDINLIIEVDENEVQALIGLIEMLFKEWYEAKATRDQRLKKLTAITADKNDQKNNAGAPQGALPAKAP